jgi:hypothetical protein
MKSKIIKINSELYPVIYYFYFGKRPSVLQKQIEKEYNMKLDEKLLMHHTQCFDEQDEPRIITVCIDSLPLDPFVQGILAHEIFHCVEMTFSFIGLSHTEHSSEAWAYLIQFLTEKIYGEMY